MSPLNLHHLRLFHAVAQDGTLTGAARRLHLSASALSSQLRALEAVLGHDLFERRGRGLSLTEAGRIALDHADAIFRAAEDLSATLRRGELARRLLRVGALATLSRNFQIRFLRPALGHGEVVLKSGGQGELLRALDALELDIMLTNLAPPMGESGRYLIRRIAAQPVSLIGAPGRLARPAPLPDLLAREPLILPTRETPLRAAFDAFAARLGLRPAIAAEVDDMAMIRLLAREDAGLAVIPPIVVTDELADGRLLEAHRLPGVEEAFYAVTMERRFPNPLAQALIDAACEAGG